jgi:hypothetical protein
MGLTWLVFFSKMSDFGFYQDDYASIASFVGKSFEEIAVEAKHYFKAGLLSVDRPLAYIFSSIVVYLGTTFTDDLALVYGVGALVCSINAFMVFLILRRWLTLSGSFIGALVFLLNPCDATKINLGFNFYLQASITCALLGILFYLRQKQWAYFFAYVFGALTLLFYESGILIFLFAPFFVVRNDKLWKRLLAHILVIGVVMGLILILRYRGVFSRNSNGLLFWFYMDPLSDVLKWSKLELLRRTLLSLFIGPVGSARAMLHGTVTGARDIFTREVYLMMFFCGGLACWLGKQFMKRGNNAYCKSRFNLLIGKKGVLLDHSFYICLVGALMIPVSYVFSFSHYPPICISGLVTSVHLSATIAWGVFIGGAIEFVLCRIQWRYVKIVVIFMVGMIFILWSSYAIHLQKGYVAVWECQKRFWKDVSLLAPDIDENSVVIFDCNVIDYYKTPHSSQIEIIGGAEWGLPIVFDKYFFSTDDMKKPVVHRPLIEMLWKRENGKIFFYHDGLPDWGKWYEFDAGNTIMFSMDSSGRLLRLGELTILNNTSAMVVSPYCGIKPAVRSNTLPYENMRSYYTLNSNQIVCEKPEYIKIKFKQVRKNDNSVAYLPNGWLYHFMRTGKFGIK